MIKSSKPLNSVLYRFCSSSKISEITPKFNNRLLKIEESSIKSTYIEELKFKTKVPIKPLDSQATDVNEDILIDNKTIQLLERLSLVDFDNEKAFNILKESIQFASKIHSIDTFDVEPLYSVLESYNLKVRNDSVTDGNIKEDILKNAKVIDEDYFVAPPGNIPLQQESETIQS